MAHCCAALPSQPAMTTGVPSAPEPRLALTHASDRSPETIGPAGGPGVITILATDAGFKTENCGTWSPLPATGTQATSFGDGAYAVGIAIAPGTYTTSGSSDCYWEKDQNYTGDETSIISNNNVSGPVTLTIPASTKEFKPQGCGTWHAP